jgi:hypothetical protein
MARLGHLTLRQGRWQDRQVIPAAWVKEITTLVTPVRDLHPGWFSTASGLSRAGSLANAMCSAMKRESRVFIEKRWWRRRDSNLTGVSVQAVFAKLFGK